MARQIKLILLKMQDNGQYTIVPPRDATINSSFSEAEARQVEHDLPRISRAMLKPTLLILIGDVMTENGVPIFERPVVSVIALTEILKVRPDLLPTWKRSGSDVQPEQHATLVIAHGD